MDGVILLATELVGRRLHAGLGRVRLEFATSGVSRITYVRKIFRRRETYRATLSPLPVTDSLILSVVDFEESGVICSLASVDNGVNTCCKSKQ